jgi:transposase
LLPPPGEGGRPEKHPRRAIVDAVLYVVRTGCSWRQLPADFPPWQTVYWYFVRWEKQRVTLRMLDALRARSGGFKGGTLTRQRGSSERTGRRHRRP